MIYNVNFRNVGRSPASPLDSRVSKVSLLFFAVFREGARSAAVLSYPPRLPPGACRSLPPVYRWARGLRAAKSARATIDVGVT